LLTHSDSTDGNTTFTDSSLYEHTLGTGGTSCDHSTDQFKIGATSIDTHNGWMTTTGLNKFCLGREDFNIACWIYPDNVTGPDAIMAQWDASSNQKSWWFGVNGGYLEFKYTTDGSTETTLTSTTAVTTGSWQYVEVVRRNADLVFRVDGTPETAQSISTDAIWGSTANVLVGSADSNLANCFQGYIDEPFFDFLRLSNTAAITPPTDFLSNQYDARTLDGHVYYSCSFDGKQTYNVYSGSAWRPIASMDENIHGNVGDSDWYYRDNASTWSKSGVSNRIEAISAAVTSNTNNQNEYTLINSLTNTEWTDTNGFSPTVGNFDIAFTFEKSTIPGKTLDSPVLGDTAYWLSPIIDLSKITDTIDSSNVSWALGRNLSEIGDSAFATFTASYKVYACKTGDTAWTECTNNDTIPGIVNGLSTTGVSIQFRVEHDVVDDITKYFPELYVEIN
jgi:hypothetical protein